MVSCIISSIYPCSRMYNSVHMSSCFIGSIWVLERCLKVRIVCNVPTGHCDFGKYPRYQGQSHDTDHVFQDFLWHGQRHGLNVMLTSCDQCINQYITIESSYLVRRLNYRDRPISLPWYGLWSTSTRLFPLWID